MHSRPEQPCDWHLSKVPREVDVEFARTGLTCPLLASLAASGPFPEGSGRAAADALSSAASAAKLPSLFLNFGASCSTAATLASVCTGRATAIVSWAAPLMPSILSVAVPIQLGCTMLACADTSGTCYVASRHSSSPAGNKPNFSGTTHE